uniref:Uncharacterized protein n=1 Tax=viral metagenome TaxID=1070528 RepID=A0A6C0JDQ5_9ZZZZ
MLKTLFFVHLALASTNSSVIGEKSLIFPSRDADIQRAQRECNSIIHRCNFGYDFVTSLNSDDFLSDIYLNTNCGSLDRQTFDVFSDNTRNMVTCNIQNNIRTVEFTRFGESFKRNLVDLCLSYSTSDYKQQDLDSLINDCDRYIAE